MIAIKEIYNIYRRVWRGKLKILQGKLTDEEAQKAVRGIGATPQDLLMWALKDVEPHTDSKHLQIKAECDYNYNSYLIYLNFI